ncbi:MAG: AzlD domain-containing protein [Thermodesulfobacteriota bacterium]|nr:AzlD domain-containing protein [Thermodesulfobacteriota bacterium]
MDDKTVFLTICGMGAVTYLPRLLPMLLLSDRSLSPWIARWLSFVPATVLAALLAPGLLCREGELTLELDNLFLLAAIPTFFVAWRFKSFFGTVAAGMGFVALGRYFF